MYTQWQSVEYFACQVFLLTKDANFEIERMMNNSFVKHGKSHGQVFFLMKDANFEIERMMNNSFVKHVNWHGRPQVRLHGRMDERASGRSHAPSKPASIARPCLSNFSYTFENDRSWRPNILLNCEECSGWHRESSL